MADNSLLVSLVIILPIIAFFPYADAARYKSTKALTYKSSGSKTDGSTSGKQSYLRIYSRPPMSVTIRENDNEVIECRAGGSPPPVIHWLKNGQLISETEWDTVATESEENLDWNKGSKPKLGISSTKSRLYLDCASLKSSGEYTCVAENPYQRISSNTVVRVVPTSHPMTVRHCAQKSRSEKIPQIVMWSDKRLEYMNGAARLYCRANGFPRPTIDWLDADGQPVTQDPKKYQITQSGDLIIHNLKWSDMGLYMCIATNIHGSDRTETFLYPTATEKQ